MHFINVIKKMASLDPCLEKAKWWEPPIETPIDPHRPKIGSNPNILEYSKIQGTGANNMCALLKGWNMSWANVFAVQTSLIVKQIFLAFSGMTVFDFPYFLQNDREGVCLNKYMLFQTSKETVFLSRDPKKFASHTL